MPIIRSQTDAEFFVMHNSTAQDESLSWEARGMLAYLLSKPEGWKTNITDLTRQSGAGKDKCRRIFDELRDAGYVERVERRAGGKIAGYDYFVYDKSSSAKPAKKTPEVAGSPEPAKPEPAEPDTANPDHIKNRGLERTESKKEQKEALCAERAPRAYPEPFEIFWKAIRGQFHKTPLGTKTEAFNEWQRHARHIPPDDLRAQWMAYLAECRRSDTSTKHVCRWLKYHGFENEYGAAMSVEDMARAARHEKWRREDESVRS